MPWKIKPSGDKFQVVNADTGKVMGTHATRAEAEAQMKALYANVPESRKMVFTVKAVGDTYRWTAMSTVNAWDRDGEMVTRQATEMDVYRTKTYGDDSEVWLFHCKSLPRLGGAPDYRAVVDGVLVESGEFDRTPWATAIAKYIARHPEGTDGSGWAVSIGFPDTRRRIYETVRIRERSPLPQSRAAVPWTRFESEEVSKMALREDQRRAFETIVKDLADDDEARSILRTLLDAKDTAKALDDAGEQRKAVAEETKPAETQTAADVTKDAAVTNPGDATQTSHGPSGLNNQPGVEKAQKCPKCGKPAHPGKPCPDDEAAEGETKAVATDLDDQVIEAIGKATKDIAATIAETHRDAIAQEVNEAITKMMTIIQRQEERLAALEGVEKAVSERYETPRNVAIYQRVLKAASVDARTELTADDPLAKLATTKADESRADADDLEASGNSEVFRAAGLKK